MLTDTHCHLNHEQLRDDLPGALARAADAGVDRMIVVGFDLASSEEAVRIAETYPGVYAAIGVHPHDAGAYGSGAEARLKELAANPVVVAIGEIGLDYHYDLSAKEDQFSAFRSQLALARAARLPVIVHCREAYPDALAVLENELDNATGGVMHCWAGTAEEAARALAAGLYLGFGGVLTFKNAGALREIATETPAEKVLVETDAPYLAPVPHRGKRNEPAYTRLVAERLADLRGTDVESVASCTTANAERLFRRLRPVRSPEDPRPPCRP